MHEAHRKIIDNLFKKNKGLGSLQSLNKKSHLLGFKTHRRDILPAMRELTEKQRSEILTLKNLPENVRVLNQHMNEYFEILPEESSEPVEVNFRSNFEGDRGVGDPGGRRDGGGDSPP